MKKKFSKAMFITLAVMILLTVIGLSTAFASETQGYYTYEVYNDEVTIRLVDNRISGKITIPSKLGGYPVTTIKNEAFLGCSAITSVTIPSSVTSIGDYAFSSCTKLTTITIPSTVTSIGKEAFLNTAYYNNTANWTKGVLYIGKHLITAKTSLSGKYTIASGTKTIANYAFYECDKLTGITIPDSVTHIGDKAFYYCENITSLKIPSSVTRIGNYAFAACYELKSITVPDSVTSIGYGAFNYTDYYYTVSKWNNNALYVGNHLVDVIASEISGAYTIKSGTKVIADETFSCIENLTKITIPDSVTTIGDYAFYYCSKLTSVTMGNSVTKIGDSAFSNCKNLTSITISDSVKTIGNKAFYYCKTLTSITIPDSVKTIGEYGFACCDNLKTVKIGNSVTRISDYTFYDCTNLTSLTIGNSVTKIGNWAFNYCQKLKSIKIPESVKTIASHAFYHCDNVQSIRIGSSVTTIGDYAFAYCSGVTNITIPDSVKIIDERAFAYCEALTDVTIGTSTTTIGEDAFCGCSALISVIIPDSVQTIGDYAFYCYNLCNIYYTGTQEQWENIQLGYYVYYPSKATIYYNYNYPKYTFSLSSTSYTYNGSAKKPTVTVKDHNGNVLTNNVDYTVTYPSGRTAPGTYYVDITINGDYPYTKTLAFKINPIDISKCTIKLSATSVTYNGKERTPTVTVKNANGVKLTKDKHYTVTYESGRVNAGTYKVTVKMIGNYTGTKTLSFQIKPVDVSKCTIKLSATSVTYNGKERTPTVTVKNASGTKLTKDKHYTVTYSSGRKNVGTYKVTIKMKGNYTGSKTLTFKILPPKTTVSSLKAGTKSITVNLTKKTTQVTGYEIQYSTSKNFTNAKTKLITSNSTTKTTLSNLSASKTYYVRVRTYKTVNNVKYYSGWSAYKSVKTK